MESRSPWRGAFWIVFSGLLVFSFQNCTGKFSSLSGSQSQSSALSNGSGETPLSPVGPVIRPPLPVDLDANPKLANLPENTALDLGAVSCDQPTDGDGCAFPTDYSRITYDATRNQVYAWGGGHGNQLQTTVLTYDLKNFKWTAPIPSTMCKDMVAANVNPANGSWLSTGQPIARHTWDCAVMGEVNGVRKYILLSDGGIDSASFETCSTGPANSHGRAPYPAGGIVPRIGYYDPAAGTWAYSKHYPGKWWAYHGAAEFDPISKKVIITKGDSGFVFDPSTDELTATFSDNGALTGYSNNMVYYPPNQKMYYLQRGGNTNVTEITLNRADWGKTLPVTINTSGPGTSESGWAYDARNQVIGGGVQNGEIYFFDPQTNSWVTKKMLVQSDFGVTDVGTMPESAHTLDFDSKDGVFIFIANRRMWAYRYR